MVGIVTYYPSSTRALIVAHLVVPLGGSHMNRVDVVVVRASLGRPKDAKSETCSGGIHVLVCFLEKQGSWHYPPEHCLVNGGVPLFVEKTCFKWLQHVSFKEP